MHTAAPGASSSNQDEFRIDAGPEIESWLRQLQGLKTRVTLGTPDGVSVTAPLVDIDPVHGGLSFEVRGDEAGLQALQSCDEVLALAYLDNIRLEFELGPMMLVLGPEQATLRAPMPPLLYRFQRRLAFRVQSLGSNYPRVRLRHPMWPEMQLELRVLDVSATGLALLLPSGVPEIAAGLTMAGVQVELERDSRFEATIRLRHISSGGAEVQGIRLGCAFVRLPDGAQRALQSFIDLTQRRQRLLKKP